MSALDDSLNRLIVECQPSPKLFWGSPDGLALGTGLVYAETPYPLLDTENGRFDTVAGTVIVLTHECDVSQDNQRYFNEELLICPIIPFEDFIESYQGDLSLDAFINGFLPALSKNQINRVMYIPPVSDKVLPQGGLIYLNQICSTHVSMFKDKKPVSTITAPGLEKLDMKLRNHLFRQKSQVLPFTYAYMPSLRTKH